MSCHRSVEILLQHGMQKETTFNLVRFSMDKYIFIHSQYHSNLSLSKLIQIYGTRSLEDVFFVYNATGIHRKLWV